MASAEASFHLYSGRWITADVVVEVGKGAVLFRPLIHLDYQSGHKICYLQHTVI
jgi:hypothetical protein